MLLVLVRKLLLLPFTYLLTYLINYLLTYILITHLLTHSHHGAESFLRY